uniref:DM2 domain-containing protein n=1 Tax=viral metagenome TaxID=1070528 RepID=A0A6C0LX90_9ZZZZ
MSQAANQQQQQEATTTSQSEVETLFQSILDDSQSLQTSYKSWCQTVKKLQKEMEKEAKKLAKQKPKRKVKQKPQKVTKAMRAFMVKNGGEDSDSYTRQVMMKAVSVYIKEKKLQNEANKKQWAKDATLTKLFGLKEEWYTFMQINGILSRIVVKSA